MNTSNSHASHVGHAYVTGVNAYMIKPITQAKLEEKLISGGLINPTAA
jgi:response regulator of citrate/malate metabolism